jgi:uncharacterized protein YceH (UPF0502 family)
MSAELTSVAEIPTSWPVLTAFERRVLGVLVEKAKTTPDVYPLSLNSLGTGCNQKSNRDPVMTLNDDQVEEALASAQKKGLVVKITGSGRVERWRHVLYEAWRVDKVELAILAELLLRGPQTEGELRTRASRMEPIADLDALRAVLKVLAERKLVVYLTPEGRRGTILTHGFHAPEDLERLRGKHKADAEARGDEDRPSPTPAAPATGPARAALEARLNEASTALADLRGIVTDLETKVAGLVEDVRKIKDGLGLS